ncbi:MAG: ABC transporter ATP-binding protein [Clostridiales bacterium]|nr:ABC transporter ATP-binding protein [Clostridiales bacterium]
MHERRRARRPMGPPPGGGFRGGPGGPMGMPAEKAKDFKGTLKRVLKYLKPYWWGIALIAVLSICSSLFTVISPRVQGNAITIIEQGVSSKAGINYTALYRTLLIMGSIYILTTLFSFLQQFIVATISQKLVFSLRRDIEAKLAKLPLKYYDSHTHGEILSRITNDVDTVSSTLQMSVTQIVSSAITIVGVLFMMLRISPLLTLIALLITPLYLLVVYVIAPKSQRYFIAQQTALGDLNSHVEEMFTGHKIVKAFNREKDSIEEFEQINQMYYTFSRRANFISGMIMPIMHFLGNLGYVAMCIVGGIFVSRRTISLGDMQAFMQYVRLFNQPITQTSNIANVIQSTIASAERVFDILNAEEEVPEAANPRDIANPEGAVRFENIRFGYSEDKILMQDLSIDVKPGQTVAIVGPTGAGKTTLVNLLMRFYDVMDGRITIDGVDIREMTRGGLRSIFGMVLQDTWLFNGTIRDNISYGKTDATDEEIVQAAVAACADHFIRTLPDGYNTVINEEASNISQGQKQLLTIARAFLADPSILILDEATSSVDTRTEVLIQNALAKLKKGRTSFVIAHRLSTIRNADIILVMNNGSIIEKGTHEELLNRKGFYYELYNSQFMNGAESQAV